MRRLILFLTLSLLSLGVYSQGSCQTSTVSGNACGEYSNGCPGATFFSPRGHCKESFELVDNAKCCCGCPKEQVNRHHCIVQFVAQPPFNYKSPGNVIGFCQDQKHFIAGDPNDLFSYEQCKAAQEKIIGDMNTFYQVATGRTAVQYFKAFSSQAKVAKNSQGISYWVFKIWEGIELDDARFNVTSSCPTYDKIRPAQCALDVQNPCKGSLQGRFEVSTDKGYNPGYSVRREPTWRV